MTAIATEPSALERYKILREGMDALERQHDAVRRKQDHVRGPLEDAQRQVDEAAAREDGDDFNQWIQERNQYADQFRALDQEAHDLYGKKIPILKGLRDVLVERLEDGQKRIYAMVGMTEDVRPEMCYEFMPTAERTRVEQAETRWEALLQEYNDVSTELNSLTPQVAVEAYAQSLTKGLTLQSKGARPVREVK